MKKYRRKYVENIELEEVKSLYKKLGAFLDVLKGTKSSLTEDEINKLK